MTASLMATQGTAGEIILAVFLLAVGIVLIVKGGDWFVDAASWIAEVSGLPPLLIGATVVSVATTLPELIVSIIATARGSADIAVGNAVGSVVANLGLIMAISLFFMPGKVDRKQYIFKSVVLIVAVFNLLMVGWFGGMQDGNHIMNVGLSILVLELFVLFLGENVVTAVRAMKNPVLNELSPDSTGENVAMDAQGGESGSDLDTSDASAGEEPVKKDKKTILINVLKFLAGAGGIVGGAELLVSNGQTLATAAGVAEGIIAVTLVAIGTSLPELVTTISAIIKKKAEQVNVEIPQDVDPAGVRDGFGRRFDRAEAVHYLGHSFLLGAFLHCRRADAHHQKVPKMAGRCALYRLRGVFDPPHLVHLIAGWKRL